ncbi:hypothetical protein C4588_05845 [Candidatus Parcubacteria bacterium]|nr:MAG: hypothetical protein C4588_05845 [Candidatus Parcubacteria bacterium]
MLKTNGKYLSVKEASLLTGKSVTVIYRKIKSGKLGVETVLNSGKPVLNVKKSDLITVFGMSDKTGLKQEEKTVLNTDKTVLTEDKFKILIEEFFQEKETKLMKPLEEMAIFRVGKLEAEKQFLKDKVDTLLQELEAYRALPGPPGEVLQKLEQTEAEKTDLASQLEIATQVKTAALKEKEEATTALQMVRQEKESALAAKEQLLADRENTVQELKQQNEQILSEKEKEAAELQALKEKAEQEEKDYMATIEELKKRLEEERNRPWWRKLF